MKPGTVQGVESTAGGNYSLYVLLCPGEHVTDVSLSVSDSDFSKIGRTAWSITANGSNTVAIFTPGQTPTGFVAGVPLDFAILPSQPLIFRVRTDGPHGIFLNDFKPSELRIDKFYLRGPSLLGTRTSASAGQLQSVRNQVCSQQGHDAGG